MRELGFAFVTVVLTFAITSAPNEPVKVVEDPAISSVQVVETAVVVPVVAKPVETIKLRYGFTDADIYLLAQLLCGDKDRSGDGEYDIDFKKLDNINQYEISKVLCVVMNRVNDHRFPDTVREVVLAKNQFSVMPRNLKAIPSDMALKVVRDWCNAYDRNDAGAQSVPTNHIFFSGNGVTNTTRP